LNFTDWSVESSEFGSTIRWQRRPAWPADPGAAGLLGIIFMPHKQGESIEMIDLEFTASSRL
jgi:hypothetical protein